jgi:phosphatidylserine decarboxylase
MKNNLFIITQSGWSYVAISLIASILFSFFGFILFAVIAFLLMLLFAYLFRNPEREFLHFEEQAVVSPVDGRVIAVVVVENDPNYAYRVDIESSYKELSILRVPVNAEHVRIKHQNGVKVSKESALFESLSENAEIIFESVMGTIKVEHRLTQSFAPISLELSQGQKVFKSSRYGMMQCGITSIYLPQNIRLDVNLADELEASQTLIGFLS